MNASSLPTSSSDDFQRWTAKRQAAVILELIKGTTSAAEVARQHALSVGKVE